MSALRHAEPAARLNVQGVARLNMRRRIWHLLILVVAVHVLHGQTPEGSGIVYGETHAFCITAPHGWVLDNRAERNNGLHAVFYPEGSSWAKSAIVMYANAANKGPGQETVDELIAYDTGQFKAKAPKLVVVELTPIKTTKGSAKVLKFSGDQYNNTEAVAYIDSPKAVVMLVLTSRDEAGFNKSYPAFVALVESYRFLTSDVSIHPGQPPN